MTSGADRSPSGRRIFSRITSPFTSSTRNVTEFSIHPEHKHKSYAPGDIVKGHVRLRVAKPIRITHVIVCLHGFVQVYKNPGSPGEGFRATSGYLGTGRGKKSGEYFGNGFASLFEDEEVLCGDGRLAEGEYRFQFELEFPKRGLPSSIDFERGTISYMITATLTRPNAMSPTMSCDRKVYLVESIDVSTLDPPKSRDITLEPVSRRSRAKARKQDTSDKSRNSNSVHQDSETSRQSDTASSRSVQTDSQNPGSPVTSQLGFESRRSSNSRMSQPESQSHDSPTSTPTQSEAGKKTINATIEPQTGGCLQGDYISVKVNVSHTKPIKGIYGVILTLFRQARVDMHPSIPLGPIEKGKEGKYEDYYPRSMTGLGGLSLSGAGSSHVFRKDLYQTMWPLIVDPRTMLAEVNAKVRVPEEAFPTISTVPGAMISFRYYVEVIVDIQGKLSGLGGSANNLPGQAPPPGHFINSEGSDMERSAFTPYGSTIIDTAPIRRDKGVVTFTFEAVIGTVDSEKRKGKQKAKAESPSGQLPQSAQNENLPPTPHQQAQGQAHAGSEWYGDDGYYDYQWYQEQPYPYYGPDQYHPAYYDHGYYDPPPPPPPTVPIPQIADESQMTEKERIQQAERRLLPSQPPGMDDPPDDHQAGATAPFIPEENSNGMLLAPSTTLPEYEPIASSSAVPTSNVLGNEETQSSRNGTTPELGKPVIEPAPNRANGQWGSQEVQLQAAASAAREAEVDTFESSSQVTDREPTAPSLADVVEERPQDIHDSHADATGSFSLPRYER